MLPKIQNVAKNSKCCQKFKMLSKTEILSKFKILQKNFVKDGNISQK